ncbi:hypothetical protein PVMG_03657 [Plasmodium vivax Mauritania I]|uniref:Variable surface protein Vir35 n=1 Tax=Plasmodium vivax Mauritania I TaxID=1035515 RepID=A0A0J9TCA2_PLAVI|nr:hypothetical protein PVMG_03657 [Plasmodium vivax Mauritania I]
MAKLKKNNTGINSQYGKSLEYMYKQQRTWKTEFNRLLARYEQLSGLESTKLREKLSDRKPYTEKSNVSGNISAYSHVKRNESNNIDVYMKNYKHRYGKKKGLSKLDCYYENKVFGKFNNICDIGKKMQYDEKRSKSFFVKKYGIGLILFALIPTLGLIFPILFGDFYKMPGIFGLCPSRNGEGSHFNDKGSHKNSGEYASCSKKWIYDNENTINKFGEISCIFSFIMIAIVFLVLFYIFIKIIKYEKIKAGKGKMNVKEYYRFCKNVF